MGIGRAEEREERKGRERQRQITGLTLVSETIKTKIYFNFDMLYLSFVRLL